MFETRGFLVIGLLAVMSCVILPAYGEVTSLQTNSQFYKGGSKIYFSGTTSETDQSGVTIVIFDPTNQFILLASGIPDNNHKFQIIVDTGISDNQPKFSLKGVYNATAFVAKKEDGKTASFVFSPDGSPITSSAPIGLTASYTNTTEVDLTWKAPVNDGGSTISEYKIERNDGSSFNFVGNTQVTTYRDTGLTPDTQYSYRVSAINAAGTSEPSNEIIVTTLTLTQTQSLPPSTTNTNPSLDELIQQRIEQAKKLQEQLNSQNKQQSIELTEDVKIDENTLNPVIATASAENVLSSDDHSTSNYAFKDVIYPLIASGGAAIVATVLYLRKKGFFSRIITSETNKEITNIPSISVTAEKEDHAMSIIKNRLAKGEITVDEFKSLKDALSEP